MKEFLIEGKGQKLFEHAVFLSQDQNPSRRLVVSTSENINSSTRFDLASLTKPFGTALAVLRLLAQGKLSLEDPISKHLSIPKEAPAYPYRDQMTLRHLLLHRSGLAPGVVLRRDPKSTDPKNQLLRASMHYAPDQKTHYSDVGYIWLGFVVESVSHKKLGTFLSEDVYPGAEASGLNYGARTGDVLSYPCSGEGCLPRVHDPLARALPNWNMGHAGLFGSAQDLANLLTKLLDLYHPLTTSESPSLPSEGKWTLGAEHVSSLFEAATPESTRTLLWDLTSPSPAFAAARGSKYPKGASMGHTGFTGVSVWIAPKLRRFYILLTDFTARSTSREQLATVRSKAADLSWMWSESLPMPQPGELAHLPDEPNQLPCDSGAIRVR
jgi:CubicO group peptidase (beta-lactamase class C family)